MVDSLKRFPGYFNHIHGNPLLEQQKEDLALREFYDIFFIFKKTSHKNQAQKMWRKNNKIETKAMSLQIAPKLIISRVKLHSEITYHTVS